MNLTQHLLDFSDQLEQKEIVNSETGTKIKAFIRKMESPSSWELFLIIGGIMGSLFVSAGVFAIISHNWDDFPKHIRGFLSIVPVVVALFFYYRMLFHHKDSKTWVEASSIFLILMIGASIALVSQTYQMDGDFTKFIKVWMLLTLPMFYLARASGIALFYLMLILALTVEISFTFFWIPNLSTADTSYWYWLLLLAFLPHYYFSLNKDKKTQSIRVVFLSYILYASLYLALAITVKGNYLLWFTTFQVGFYLFGKRFMGDNSNIFARPFQWMTQLSLVWTLLVISNKFVLHEVYNNDSIFNYANWGSQETYYFILLLVVMAGVYFNFIISRSKLENTNYLIVFAPAFILLTMLIDEYTESWWWLSIFINFYILILGITTMIQGSSTGNVLKMAAGLIAISILLWIRYFDTELGFISKGIIFMGVGGVFFFINLLVKEKVEDIKRNKKNSLK